MAETTRYRAELGGGTLAIYTGESDEPEWAWACDSETEAAAILHQQCWQRISVWSQGGYATDPDALVAQVREEA